MAELYIDGTWREPVAGGLRTIRCPADGRVVATVSEATAADADAAVLAARRACAGGWPDTPARERGALLLTVADLLERDSSEFATAESLDTGKRIVESRIDVADAVACLRYYGALAGLDPGRVIETGRPDVLSQVEYAPVGVCALVTPWNYPLLQAVWKVAPALAAGNAFVLKPSELTPSTAVLLIRALVAAGLPDGVGNLVLGPGDPVGARLTSHPAVDLVSFTGGRQTGKAVMAAAAATVKRVTLELGGKNPNLIFADADLDAAVDHALTAAFLHSGQVCSAGSRLLLDRRIHRDFVAELARRAARIRLGGPFDPAAETGPLISAEHRERVERYVADGIAEGAAPRCGAARPTGGELDSGFFYLPTVLDQCRAGMRVVADEGFGPVLTVECFDTEQEAVALANDTIYGLAGAVWTADVRTARRVAGRLRLGTVWINDYHPYLPQAEWGGFKQSGTGRELGPTGLAEYRQTRHVWQNLDPCCCPVRTTRGEYSPWQLSAPGSSPCSQGSPPPGTK